MLILFWLALGIASQPGYAEPTVSLVADDWCPYTCSEHTLRRGLMVDVADAAFAAVGLTSHYVVTGWRRGFRNVAVGKMDVLLGADNSMREDLLLDDQFVVLDETVLLINKNSGVEVAHSGDLARYSIGVIAEYHYADAEAWEAAIATHGNKVKIGSSAGERRLIELLLVDRFQVALVNREVATYVLAQMGAVDSVAVLRPGMQGELFFGFSPNVRGQYLLQKFQAGYRQLVASGELARIYQRYGIAQ